MTDVLPDLATAAPGPTGAVLVLELVNLSVSYADHHRKHRRVVHEVSLKISPGEVLALVGESGSGKSTTAQAVIGLLAGNGRVDGGRILLNGTDIAGWSQKRLESIRGAKIALIPQDPTSSLNPVLTVGAQVEEVLRLHTKLPKPERRKRVLDLLARVGIPEPERRAGQYAHELSGGMKQRVLIAAAIALEPQLIIADEATSALDVTVQRRILDLIDDLRAETGTAVLFVTHDLGVAADRADRVVVLKGGRVQEQGPTTQVLTNPSTDYTRQLLADAPSISPSVGRPAPKPGRENTVEVYNLIQEFDSGRNQPRFRAVDDVSFQVPRGSTHAIVGESGSGKTTTARALAGFQRPTSGSISISGHELSGLDAKSLRQFRKHVQLVYQNPFTSLDPRQTIGRIIEEPLLNFGPGSRQDRAKAVRDLLDRVHLPEGLLTKHPRELSGGQRQRVAIARALVLRPQVLILDEAVSALDVTVQSQILTLLEELQRELDLTYVFITHDLAVVRQIADTVSVMSGGRQVEDGTVSEVFDNPQHHYTRDLIEAIPGNRKAKQ
ncbi:ABC transporter ATP-binding protein [Arthrobacter sp. StoSoilB5]|uniref:dipeptide ABC transporter ATP-binding protein n=1 Tax=Arthrobacter sp. StoSoilB5 TaxID=2830992 RepID=UPI001CC5B731|nr:ABC transporter ATP-binding protein [Arthrobacter sp. StoSoilB5]BCW44912.1 ABC transporter ATP-binding protein [Arthrobacter sp. StoSoilB5]